MMADSGAPPAGGSPRLLVGTYAKAGGPGLVPLRQDAEGRWLAGTAFPVANASYALVSAKHGHHYCVDEAAGTVGVYSASGGWACLAAVETGGEAPCHLALSPDERFLAVANYEGGSISLFALDQHGLPGPRDVLVYRGSGPDRERQSSPHPHWVGFSASGELIVVDLGCDHVVAHMIDDRGVLSPQRLLYAAPPGSGPRHLAFHPLLPIAYLVSELEPTLTVLKPAGARFEAAERLSLLGTAEAPPHALGGAIAMGRGARRLYLTTRGIDRLVTVALDAEGGACVIGRTPSGGQSPRYVLVHENRLFVAHEEGGGVAVFAVDDDGVPIDEHRSVALPGAAMLMVDAPDRR